MMKQKKNKTLMFGGIALGILSIGAVLAILGMSNTMSDISEKAISKTPDAILASAGVSEEKLVSVPVVYYDQKADQCVNLYDVSLSNDLYKRQFEWTRCGYYNKEVEQGLVGYELDKDYLPVATGDGVLTANRGINMKRWFSAAEGQSTSYSGTLKMKYQAAGAEFIFEAEDFYPLDAAEFSDGDFVNEDGHNHLFTMNFAVPFTVLASGNEEVEIEADDDTFVFVGNKLAIDIGGVHEAVKGRLVVHKDGEIYVGVDDEDLAYSGIKVNAGEGSIVRIFHADRDSEESVFNVKFAGMNLSVTDTKMAENGNDGIKIAYDPSDPTYVAPLGESSVFRPDSTKGLIVMVTLEGVMVVVISILVASVARFMVKQKVRK